MIISAGLAHGADRRIISTLIHLNISIIVWARVPSRGLTETAKRSRIGRNGSPYSDGSY